jgi:hypothetical protein
MELVENKYIVSMTIEHAKQHTDISEFSFQTAAI